MADQVKFFNKRCLVCQQTKVLKWPPWLGMQLYGAGFPNKRIHVKYCGPMAKLTHEYKYLFVVWTLSPSSLSRSQRYAWQHVELGRFCMTDGWMCYVQLTRHTPTGSLTAGVFKEFCRKMAIEHTMTTSYRPKANGQSEQANRNIIEMLRTMIVEADDLQVWFVTAPYNFTIHSAHGFSPYFKVMKSTKKCSVVRETALLAVGMPVSPTSSCWTIATRLWTNRVPLARWQQLTEVKERSGFRIYYGSEGVWAAASQLLTEKGRGWTRKKKK